MQKRFDLIGKLLLIFICAGIYIGFQVNSIYGGDAGDLVSAIVTRGIAHPPGYPLYTLLGVLLNTFISTGTTAWRVGFLSSIPALLALVFLFDVLYFLTKRFLPSFIGTLVLGVSYPYFLYSTVVEVFALNNLFIILLLWSFLRFAYGGKKKFLYLGAYFLGLSLTHHHIILFLLPAVLYLLWQKRKLIKGKELFIFFALTLFGVLPYLYVFLSSAKDPVINWLGWPTLGNFIALITRSTYGTFRAGMFIGQTPFARLLDIWGFADFAVKDFRTLGVILFFLGFLHLLRTQKKLFMTFLLGFLSYLFFLFYASFPLSENFIVGTFERFLLPLYIFVSIFITYGILYIMGLVERLKKGSVAATLTGVIFFVYPLSLFYLNLPKISILKNDYTAENYGRDILGSVPPKSIILIAVDTPLFDSQYVYFTEKKWPDVRLVHFSKMLNPVNRPYFSKFYPDMILPDFTQSPQGQLESFLLANNGKFAIFSKQAYMSDSGVWVPWGLLFRYYTKKDLPADEILLWENEKLWASYHDPLSGSLSRYKNLILADTLRLYSLAHQEAGFWMAKRGINGSAESHLLSAEKLYPQDPDSYNILSQVYIETKRCDDAKLQLEKKLALDAEDANTYLLMSLNWGLCFRDSDKALFYQKLFEEKTKGKEIPLKKL